MITKNDCMTILVKLEDTGLNIDQYMKKLIVSKEIPIEVLRFISKNRGIEVANFYEMLRKSYNNKRSPLYKNIVAEALPTEDALITLSSMLTQIMLYNKKLDDKGTFLKDARAEEISRVLNNYYKTYDETQIMQLISLIKSDVLVLEYIAGRRDLQ